MSKTQAIFETNLDWEEMTDALKQSSIYHQVTQKGLIKIGLKNPNIIAEISSKGTLVLTFNSKECKGQAEKYPGGWAICQFLNQLEPYLRIRDGTIPHFVQTKTNYLYSGLRDELTRCQETNRVMLQTLLGVIYGSKFRKHIRQTIEKALKERENFDVYDIPGLLKTIVPDVREHG